MGVNGCGKTTLANTIMGHPKYKVLSGDILFKNKSILSLSADKRSKLGIFLSFQNPIEIPGLNYFSFLKACYNSHFSKKLSTPEFNSLVKQKMQELNIPTTFLSRDLNFGFSGGEKKRAEILQLNLLNSSLAVLDETDSGLDVDSLKLVCKSISQHKLNNSFFSAIVITHYKKILDFLRPDYVHVMHAGKIIKSGNKDFARYIEKNGFSKIIELYEKSLNS